MGCETVLVTAAILLGAMSSAMAGGGGPRVVFPGAEWDSATLESRGVNSGKLDRIAAILAGSGCVIKDGYLVKAWGPYTQPHDWASSTKPIYSTLLFFAIEEGKVAGVDEKLTKWDWSLQGKDVTLTFRHLADMTSGYMLPNAPGEAWDYNDFAISLYGKTLVRVFGQTLTEAARQRLYGPLGMQDSPRHADREPGYYFGRALLSPRDYARLCWLWMNHGRWGDKQLLPASYFERYLRPDVPKDLPFSTGADSTVGDYLHVGTVGGSTNQHRDYGPGIYGFNWWFNAPGTYGPEHRHAGQTFALNWPGVPADAFMASGYGGHNCVMIPSLGIALISGAGKWLGNTMDPGNPDYLNNQVVRLLADSVEEY